jgi:hypothetical protein
VVLNGRIYIGAFNGKLFALGPKESQPSPPGPSPTN